MNKWCAVTSADPYYWAGGPDRLRGVVTVRHARGALWLRHYAFPDGERGCSSYVTEALSESTECIVGGAAARARIARTCRPRCTLVYPRPCAVSAEAAWNIERAQATEDGKRGVPVTPPDTEGYVWKHVRDPRTGSLVVLPVPRGRKP